MQFKVIPSGEKWDMRLRVQDSVHKLPQEVQMQYRPPAGPKTAAEVAKLKEPTPSDATRRDATRPDPT